jgi:hypothetical protein
MEVERVYARWEGGEREESCGRDWRSRGDGEVEGVEEQWDEAHPLRRGRRLALKPDWMISCYNKAGKWHLPVDERSD